MKRITALLMCLVVIFCFASCKEKDKTSESESGTAAAKTTADVSVNEYNKMVTAAKNGEYEKALEYYNSGAADVADDDLLNWYYYSFAMAENEKYGCVGYPLNLMQNNVSDSFEPAKKAMAQLKAVCENLNGAYESEGRYIYITDGKIAVSIGTHLSDSVFCNAEIAEKDGTLYYSDRKSDGTHINSYSVEKTEDGRLIITATAENNADIYSGEYIPMGGTCPEIIY